MEACGAHNPKVGGSKPLFANFFFLFEIMTNNTYSKITISFCDFFLKSHCLSQKKTKTNEIKKLRKKKTKILKFSMKILNLNFSRFHQTRFFSSHQKSPTPHTTSNSPFFESSCSIFPSGIKLFPKFFEQNLKPLEKELKFSLIHLDFSQLLNRKIKLLNSQEIEKYLQVKRRKKKRILILFSQFLKALGFHKTISKSKSDSFYS